MFKVGGYRPVSDLGELTCSKFSVQADTLTKLAAGQDTRHIIPEFTPISNQLNANSCTGNATADCVELLKGLENPNKVEQVSRMFIYYNARNYINETNKDAGCYIAHAMDSLKTLGVCRESTWEYDTNKVFTKPTIEAYKEANDNNTIINYYQITSTGSGKIKDIETAIRTNHPIVFGVKVGQEFLDYKGENKVFDPPTTSVGGHAMIITGIRTNSHGKKEFYIKNSWGTGWGMSEPETAHLGKGHCWINEAYIDSISKGDCFVPTYVKDFLV